MKLINGYKKIIFSLIIIFLLAILVYSNAKSIYSWMYDNKLVPVKEAFTELYLDDNQNLPTTIEAGKEFTFSFVIHNLEGKVNDYPYEVTLSTDSNIIYLSKDSAKVADNEYRKINVNFFPEVSMPKGEVRVKLLERNQNLHFYISDSQ